MKQLLTEENKAPVFDESLAASYSYEEHSEIKLNCRYTSNPRCEVIWLKDNQPIDLNSMGLTKEFKVEFIHNNHYFV